MATGSGRKASRISTIWIACACGKGLDLRNTTGICWRCRESRPRKPRGKICEPGCTCGKHNGALRGRRLTDSPTLITQHDRVKKIRGQADEHLCYGCSEAAYDWANIHGSDRLDTASYIALCRPCHIIYDRSGCNLDDLKDPGFRAGELSKIMKDMRAKRR